MKENEKAETTSTIVVEVKTQNFNSKGELISAIAAGSKLTKADAGRIGYVDEDSITVKSSGCGCPKIEVDHNATSLDAQSKEAAYKNTTVEVDVKAQILDTEKKALVDAIASEVKLNRIENGIVAGRKSEDWLHLEVEGANGAECGKTELRGHSKITRE
ncbi:MAG: hypothetical protein HYX39_09970 [Bacteroidetes bacterium]|nr:hypothetical protein [Bacteroidota bacterium]